MKKLFMALFIALCLIVSGSFATADETTKTITFQWEQPDKTNLKEWKVLWGDTSGTYDRENPVATITYDPNIPGPTYTGSTPAVVQGPQGTHVMKYFVMIACGDVPQSSGGTQYLCSTDSNEVSYNFWIPAGQFSVPLNFQIVAE